MFCHFFPLNSYKCILIEHFLSCAVVFKWYIMHHTWVLPRDSSWVLVRVWQGVFTNCNCIMQRGRFTGCWCPQSSEFLHACVCVHVTRCWAMKPSPWLIVLKFSCIVSVLSCTNLCTSKEMLETRCVTFNRFIYKIWWWIKRLVITLSLSIIKVKPNRCKIGLVSGGQAKSLSKFSQTSVFVFYLQRSKVAGLKQAVSAITGFQFGLEKNYLIFSNVPNWDSISKHLGQKRWGH